MTKSQETMISHLSRPNEELVVWSHIYETGVVLIDEQHKELLNLTNRLYKACLDGDGHTMFREVMHHLVDYVKFHFSAELKLLEKVNYPNFQEHKKEHEDLARNILDAVRNYDEHKKLMPNAFVRTLKDWVFTHIAVSDRIYADYILNQKKKGLLSDKQIEDLMK